MGAVLAAAFATLFFLVLLWASARRAITVCILKVYDGEMVVAEGKIAPRVLGDLRDVVRRPRVNAATVRILRAKDRATVEIGGDLTADQLQQIRNIVGSVPLAKLANGKRAKRGR